MAIPEAVTKLFWGDDLQELSLEHHSKYIVQVILERGDEVAIRWLFDQFSQKQIKSILPTLKLSKKSDHFWSIYFA